MTRRRFPLCRRLPRLRMSGGAFTPSSPTSATLDWWWDPRDTASLTLSGSQVTAIADKSVNAFSSTGGGGASNPTKVTGGSGINGKQSIHFDDASIQWFDLPNRFGGFTAYEIHCVRQLPADPPVGANQFWTFGAGGAAVYVPFVDSKSYDDFGSDTRRTSAAPAAGVWAQPHVYSVIVTASEWTASVNGVVIITAATPTVAWTTTPRFGTYNIGAGFLGNVGEVVGYTGKLSAGDRAALYAYLKATWGLP